MISKRLRAVLAPIVLVGGLPASLATVASVASGAPPSSAKPTTSSTATGKMKLSEFEEALRVIYPALNDCYNKALNKDAVAEGDVTLVITTQGGKVLKADTDREHSSMKLDDAHKCIVGVVKKMKMPVAKNALGERDPKAIAEVRYPIEFTLGIEVSSGVSASSGAKIDYDKVKQVFFIEKVAIGRCYLDAWKAKKGVAAVGKLVIKLNVAGGRATSVDEVKSETTVTDAELKQCVYDAVKKFRFPLAKNAKGVDDEKAVATVTYPLEFKPR